MQTSDIAPSRAYTKTTGLTFSKDDKQHSRPSYHDNWLACFVGLQLTQDYRYHSLVPSHPRWFRTWRRLPGPVKFDLRICLVPSLLHSLARPAWGRGCRYPWFDQLGPVNVTWRISQNSIRLVIYFFYLLIFVHLKCIKYQRLVCEMEIFNLHHLNVNPH